MKKFPLIAVAPFFCALLLASFSARADMQRVGMITATYSMRVIGSGTNYYGDAESGGDGQDQLNLTLTGQAQFELLTTESNLITPNDGFPLTSTAQQNVSASHYYVTWDYTVSPPNIVIDNRPLVGNPNFNPSYAFMLMGNTTNGGGQFVAGCGRVSYGLMDNGRYLDQEIRMGDDTAAWPWPPVGNCYYGLACVNRAMDLAQANYFYITNSTSSWTLTLSTNLTVQWVTNASTAITNLASGTATISNSLTLSLRLTNGWAC